MLVDVDHTMKIMTEETFGPTLPIMKVADADEAVRLANDSPYGLGALGLRTRHRARRGDRAAPGGRRGRTSTTRSINYTALELPMGGAKASGLGSRHGAGGIRKYCSQQAIVVTPRLALKRELHMFPYKRRAPRAWARGCSSCCTGAASATEPLTASPVHGAPSRRSSSGIVVSALV